MSGSNFLEGVHDQVPSVATHTFPTCTGFPTVAMICFPEIPVPLKSGVLEGIPAPSSGCNIEIAGAQASSIIGRYTAGTNPFIGSLDEFKIYDKALSAEQISKLAENSIQSIMQEETSPGDNWSSCTYVNDGWFCLFDKLGK